MSARSPTDDDYLSASQWCALVLIPRFGSEFSDRTERFEGCSDPPCHPLQLVGSTFTNTAMRSMAKSGEQVMREFDEAVNMSAGELEE